MQESRGKGGGRKSTMSGASGNDGDLIQSKGTRIKSTADQGQSRDRKAPPTSVCHLLGWMMPTHNDGCDLVF